VTKIRPLKINQNSLFGFHPRRPWMAEWTAAQPEPRNNSSVFLSTFAVGGDNSSDA
jgi:hypothetical protein